MLYILIDIIILGFIVISGFIGYKKGLTSIIINFIGLVLALILGFSLKGTLASFIDDKTNVKASLKETISDEINLVIESKIQSVDTNINKDEAITEKTDDTISDTASTVEDENDIKNKFYISLINKMGVEDGVDALSERVAKFILETASFIIIFITVSLCSFILKMMFNLVFKLPILSSINGTGGLVLGTIISIFKVWTLLAILSFLSPMVPKVLDIIDSTYLTKALYNVNLIVILLSGGLKF